MPRYETEEDRKSERAVLERCSKWLGLQYKQMPELYPYDAVLFDESGTVALVEVKCSPRHLSTDHANFLIRARKVDEVVALASESACSFVLIVQWSDATGYFQFSHNDRLRSRVMGRTDRGDPQDQQLHYLIPARRFTMMEEGNAEDQHTD
jgi:hypothetical protein